MGFCDTVKRHFRQLLGYSIQIFWLGFVSDVLLQQFDQAFIIIIIIIIISAINHVLIVRWFQLLQLRSSMCGNHE
jgi:hypothetical protein